MAEISTSKIMDLDTSKFRFKPTKQKSRFRELFVDLCPFVVKFPKLRLPFDSKINMYGQSEISMSLHETNTKSFTSEQIIEKIKTLDNFIQDYAKKEGFLEGFPDTIRYNPILKQSANGNFAPTVKAKIAKNKNDIDSVFMDKDNIEISFSSEEEIIQKLTKGTFLLSSIHFAGLYFNDKTYGMTLKFHKCKIYEQPIIEEKKPEIQKINFLDSSDEEDEGVLDEE